MWFATAYRTWKFFLWLYFYKCMVLFKCKRMRYQVLFCIMICQKVYRCLSCVIIRGRWRRIYDVSGRFLSFEYSQRNLVIASTSSVCACNLVSFTIFINQYTYSWLFHQSLWLEYCSFPHIYKPVYLLLVVWSIIVAGIL